MSLSRNVADRPPSYEVAPAEVLRALDPTEHNMERLNARARGSGRTYHILVIEGPLARASLEQALDALATRHPLLCARIVRGGDGSLCYAPTKGDRSDGTARLPVSYTVTEDLSAWRELVETDMNAGAIASDSGPLFAFALIEPRGTLDGASAKRVLVMAGHHSASDAASSVALLHELLEQIAEPHPLPRLPDRPLSDPFCLDLPVPELAEIEAQLQSALPHQLPQLAAQRARLERLEQHLLAQRNAEGHLPAALKTVQGLLSSVDAKLRPATGIVPEVDVGAGDSRYERTRTALLGRTLDAATTQALRRATKEHALTLHGALSAAVLFALAAERASAGDPTVSDGRLALASAVNLRKHLVPPLSSCDLRMAVDVVVSRVPVEAGVPFWELARSVGDDVTHAVASGRPLSSYFRTTPRDFDEPPPGIAIPLLSNLGRAELATQYGPLRLLDLSAAMTTHGSFQLAMLFLSFDERLSMSFYCETPTVSRAALEHFATRVVDTLSSVARGEEPVAVG
jgi:hypothetical protein